MLDPERHVGDLAELYALGELGDLDRARVERHAAGCDDCVRRLGEAEATVLRLIESEAMPVRRPANLDRRIRFAARPLRLAPWIAAVAAAFVIGLLPWGLSSLRDRGAPPPGEQQVAMNAMLHGHFLHTQFVASAPGAPAAKAIYARDGSWLYVLVAPGPDPLQIAVGTGAVQTIAATLPASSQVRSAYLERPGPAKVVRLLDRGNVVASATIVYVAK
jgi:hypothetical protein